MTSLRRVYFVILNLFCAASPAWAGDWSPDDARILGDPSFLPLAGQIEGSFGYTYSIDHYDVNQNEALGFHASYHRSDNDFLPRLSFGITDEISVFANLGFGNSRNVEQETYGRFVFQPDVAVVTGRARLSFRTIGAEDPVFGATWRVIDQARAPVNVDLTGSYAPDIFQGRAALRAETGTLAVGGQTGHAEIAVSREMQIMTVQAYGEFTYAGRRNEITDDGAEDLRSAPHASYTIGLQSQARVLPWLAINAGISASQAVRFDRFLLSSFGTSPQTVKPSGSISPYGGVVIPLWGNHVVSEFLYQHDFVNNESVDTSFGLTTRFYKQDSNAFTARVLFAFGGAPAPTPVIAPTQPAMTAPPVAAVRTYLVFFDWDRADLTARARQIVAQAAQASTQAQVTRIDVDGYTDLSGTVVYNQRLSIKRAQAVQAELVRDGVAANAIAIHGHGESNPLVQTAQGVREPQNRRVEIVFR